MATSSESVAWLYLRLSKEKGTSADSLVDQERKLRERARAEGLTVERVFSEGAGRSAYGSKGLDRPVWEELVSSVRPGVVVMAVESSRFARNTEDGLRQIRRIRKAGGEVVTLDGNDTRQDGSALPLTVRLAVAEEESRLKSERLVRARERERRLGKWGGRAPYGYRRRKDGKLELDPDTAPIARRIVDMAMSGHSAASIARTLNAEGIPNPNGRQWRQVSVSAYLRNPVLVGWLPHEGQPYLGDDGEPVVCVVGPTILSVAERGRLLATVRGRTFFDRTGVRRGTGRPTEAILRNGVLRCGRCGGAMSPSGRSYHCRTRAYGGTCQGLTVTRRIIEEDVLRRVTAWLAALDADDPRLEAVARQWIGTGDGGQSEARAIEAAGELDEARQRLADLDEARFLRGLFDGQEQRYEELRAALTDRIASLEVVATSTAPSTIDVGPLLDIVQTREALETAPAEVVASLISATVTRMVVQPAERRGMRWDPSRLVIEFIEGPGEEEVT